MRLFPSLVQDYMTGQENERFAYSREALLAVG